MMFFIRVSILVFKNIQKGHGTVCHKAVVQSTPQRRLDVSIEQSQLPSNTEKENVSFFPLKIDFFQALPFCLIHFFKCNHH